MGSAKTKILVVDDDALDCRQVRLILAKSTLSESFDIDEANTLAEACEKLTNSDYEIVLLDLNLTDSTGIDTVKKTRSVDSDASIIVLTGLDDEETGLEAIRQGADDYIVKGDALEQMLIRTIRYSLERRSVRQRLLESEKRFRSVVQTAGCVIFVLSPEFRILEWNQQAEHIFGWSRSKILNGNYLELFIPSEIREKVTTDLMRVISEQKALSSECLIRVRDGSQRILSWDVSPLSNARGRIAGLIAVAQDITDRKLMEDELKRYRSYLEQMVRERTINLESVNDQLRQEIEDRKQIEKELTRAKQQAETANQAKSEFLANISHELRTPLHSILSFASFGVKKYANSERTKLLDFFSRIKQSGTTLLNLLNDLLDLAKLESSGSEFTLVSTNLDSLIKSIISEISSLLSERNLTIRYETCDLNENVLLDSDKIKQVLRNLLDNAIKFSPDGGVIDVAISHTDTAATVSISDSGPGIPKDELETVFDKFVQSSKTKTGAGGTGLGLAISHEIIKAHRGRIWAENRHDVGAVFSFEIPLTHERRLQNETLTTDVTVA